MARNNASSKRSKWVRSTIQLAQDVEATAFALLKGRFHTHAPGIDLHLSASCSLIADKEPRLLTVWIPHQADVRVQRFLLPDPGPAIPAIAALEHEVVKALPRLFECAVEIPPTGMLCTHAQQLMPAVINAELDQRHTR